MTVALGTGSAVVSDTFNLGGTGNVALTSGTLTLSGGGEDSDSGGGFNLSPGATLNINNGYTFDASATIQGAGNFTASGGTVNVAGALNAGGTWTFSSGTVNLTGTTTASGNTVNINGATVNFNGTGYNGLGQWQPGALNMSSGTLAGAAPVAVQNAGGFDWTGGQIGTGAGNGGIVNFNGGTFNGYLYLDGGQLTNSSGTPLAWSAIVYTGQGSVINNNGTINISSGVSGYLTYPDYGGKQGAIDNAGTITVALGTGSGLVYDAFNITGTGNVALTSGTLNLQGGGTDGDSGGGFNISSGATLNLGAGAYTANPGSMIQGAGNFQVNGGTASLEGSLNVTGPWTFSGGTANLTGSTTTSGNTVTVNGGTVNFNGTGYNGLGPWQPGILNLSSGLLGGVNTVAVQTVGGFTWTGGQLGNSTADTGIVSCNGAAFSGGNTLALAGGQVINSGVLNWGDPSLNYGYGSIINNTAAGTINLTVNLSTGNYGARRQHARQRRPVQRVGSRHRLHVLRHLQQHRHGRGQRRHARHERGWD